jgi:hypothetical protein
MNNHGWSDPVAVSEQPRHETIRLSRRMNGRPIGMDEPVYDECFDGVWIKNFQEGLRAYFRRRERDESLRIAWVMRRSAFKPKPHE